MTLAAEESWGATAWRARTSFRYARFLAGRGDPGDEARARDLIERALADVRSAGLPDTAVPAEVRAPG
jgi:hypothetical protein